MRILVVCVQEMHATLNCWMTCYVLLIVAAFAKLMLFKLFVCVALFDHRVHVAQMIFFFFYECDECNINSYR